MQDILRFHVPCDKKYTKLVEDFMRISADYLNPGCDASFILKLCTVMNEVFINIVEHTRTAEEEEFVRFQFEIGLKYFSISIYDYGPGFAADGFYPPYPKQVIGKSYLLRDVLDGKVLYKVNDPFSITFYFEEKNEVDMEKKDLLDRADENGLGMSIVAKIMDTVTYSYVGNGKFDWKLVQKLGEK